MQNETRRAQGRPRDEATGPALLDAARRLVIRDGYEAVSIQAIAAEAGVGRQTLYRRWPSKAELVLEAFLESAGGAEPPSERGPIREVLALFLTRLFENLRKDGPAIRSLIASAQSDPEFLVSFRNRFVEPRAQVVADMLQRAKADGEIKAEADLALAVDICHGAFWYRLLLGSELDAAYADRLASFIMVPLQTQT